VGQTTTWTSRLRLGDGFDMISDRVLPWRRLLHAKQLSSSVA
jgi:hypothetical protein